MLHDDLNDVLATTTHPAQPWHPWHRPITSPAVWTRCGAPAASSSRHPGTASTSWEHRVRTIIERGMLWATRTASASSGSGSSRALPGDPRAGIRTCASSPIADLDAARAATVAAGPPGVPRACRRRAARGSGGRHRPQPHHPGRARRDRARRDRRTARTCTARSRSPLTFAEATGIMAAAGDAPACGRVRPRHRARHGHPDGARGDRRQVASAARSPRRPSWSRRATRRGIRIPTSTTARRRPAAGHGSVLL